MCRKLQVLVLEDKWVEGDILLGSDAGSGVEEDLGVGEASDGEAEGVGGVREREEGELGEGEAGVGIGGAGVVTRD